LRGRATGVESLPTKWRASDGTIGQFPGNAERRVCGLVRRKYQGRRRRADVDLRSVYLICFYTLFKKLSENRKILSVAYAFDVRGRPQTGDFPAEIRFRFLFSDKKDAVSKKQVPIPPPRGSWSGRRGWALVRGAWEGGGASALACGSGIAIRGEKAVGAGVFFAGAGKTRQPSLPTVPGHWPLDAGTASLAEGLLLCSGFIQCRHFL